MQTTFKDIADFKDKLASDPDMQNAFRENPVEASKNLQDSPLTNDKWIYRIVVIALGVSILSIIIGVLFFILNPNYKDDKSIPTILTALGSAAIGALAGLLAPSPKNAK